MTSIRHAAVLGTFSLLSLAAASAQEPERILPRWREGGTPYSPQQALSPFALQAPAGLAPASGVIASPPEYTPAHGVIYRYNSSTFATVVRDCVVALTSDPAHDEIAYVVVSGASQQSSAASMFSAAGADMSKVQFIVQPTNSIWLRDYGPHFVWQGGALALADSHYYPTRPEDNFIPTLVGDEALEVPTYDMGLYYSGGNFQPGPGRSGFCTTLVNLDNPAAGGFDPASIAALYQRFQGIDTLHVMPQLPTTVDATGHIDMWMYLVDENDVIISQFKPGSNATAIQITNNAVTYMQNLGFTVHRTWAWNSGGTHYTYANAYRVNDRIFVPSYAAGNPAYAADDQDAILQWQAAAGPGVQIVPIDCYSIIPYAGAIHCIVMQVPRYTDARPSAHVLWPTGGELVPAGSMQTIAWAASDTFNASLPTVDLSWSADGGASWQFLAQVPNTGSYAWSVPQVATAHARVKAVLHATDGDTATAVSAADFRIAPVNRSVYDFASQTGTTRVAYGSEVTAWSVIEAARLPGLNALSAGAYAALSASDAVGGDSDANRYISPTPLSVNESAHVFEFTIQESAAAIDEIEITVEGYADTCAQIELYVWDYVAQRWSDGLGAFGENRYLDNWAGNRDGSLHACLHAGFDRCISAGGQVSFLAFVERSGNESFVDHVRLVVGDVPDTGSVICAGDGSATACPCANVGAPGHGCASSSSANGARLEAYGVASVAADGLQLACQGLPFSGSALFVQGSAAQNGGLGSLLGDGLRCFAGTLVRLGVHSASAGTAGFGPPFGDPAVSVRGGVPPAGGTFVYQVWYRDPAQFCAAETYNLSNGLQVTWGP